MFKRALLCCGETHTCLTPMDDKSSMLQGDAGSAMIIDPGDDALHVLLKAEGKGYQAVLTPGVNARVKIDPNHFDNSRIQETMDGTAVFEFAITQVPRSFKEYFNTLEGQSTTLTIVSSTRPINLY